MPPVLAIVFWAWALVSIVVLLRRRAAKRATARMEATGETPRPPTEGEEVVLADVDIPEPVHAMAGTAAPSAPTPPTPPPGFDGPTVPVVERPAPRSAPAAGVADALVGIRMPCDLVPLVLDRLATDHITLSTTGHAAADVGTALADEVERLGYVVHPISDHEVLATRGATHLRLTIRAPGPDGKHLTHPNAREDSVVVEIALG